MIKSYLGGWRAGCNLAGSQRRGSWAAPLAARAAAPRGSNPGQGYVITKKLNVHIFSFQSKYIKWFYLSN